MFQEHATMASKNDWKLAGGSIMIRHNRIFRVEINDPNRTVGQHIRFLNEKDATYYIAKEKWLIDSIEHLNSVRDYKTIVFGDGSKSKLPKKEDGARGK